MPLKCNGSVKVEAFDNSKEFSDAVSSKKFTGKDSGCVIDYEKYKIFLMTSKNKFTIDMTLSTRLKKKIIEVK